MIRKELIINADDFGFSKPINHAIKCCLETNRVTGVSLMATGREYKEAIDILRKLDIKNVGVHLTLTGNMFPIIGNIENTKLIQKKKFPKNYIHYGIKKILFKTISNTKIYNELEDQIRKIRGDGFNISHVDGHEHIHMFPHVCKIVIALAQKYGIPYIRYPKEKIVDTDVYSFTNWVRHIALKGMTEINLHKIKKSRLDFTNHFFGHFNSGEITKEKFLSMLSHVSDGKNEIAFHPCLYDESFLSEYPFYLHGNKELELLVNENWFPDVEKNKIQLTTHYGRSSLVSN